MPQAAVLETAVETVPDQTAEAVVAEAKTAAGKVQCRQETSAEFDAVAVPPETAVAAPCKMRAGLCRYFFGLNHPHQSSWTLSNGAQRPSHWY